MARKTSPKKTKTKEPVPAGAPLTQPPRLRDAERVSQHRLQEHLHRQAAEAHKIAAAAAEVAAEAHAKAAEVQERRRK